MNFKNIVWFIKAISYFVLLRSFNDNDDDDDGDDDGDGESDGDGDEN